MDNSCLILILSLLILAILLPIIYCWFKTSIISLSPSLPLPKSTSPLSSPSVIAKIPDTVLKTLDKVEDKIISSDLLSKDDTDLDIKKSELMALTRIELNKLV